jgi:hypothetical protein
LIQLYKDNTASQIYIDESVSFSLDSSTYLIDLDDLEILHTVFISEAFDDGFIYNNEYFPEYGIQTFLEFSTDGG